MSEEILQRGYIDTGLKITKYEYYNIGNTTLKTLKKHKVIPRRNYKKFELSKPDALLVDRRNKKRIIILSVIEHKDTVNFRTEQEQIEAIQQCNSVCNVLKAKIGIITDGSKFIWINPLEKDENNKYYEKKLGKDISYSIILDENDTPINKPFIINQKTNQSDKTQLNVKTRLSIELIEKIADSVSKTNSKLAKKKEVDPSLLAKQIWQDVWSVSGATPEKCLYTFIELFIFKYLSDLDILNEDKIGNLISFDHIYGLNPDKAFSNYSMNTREYLKTMFKPSPDDNTTIINGTVLVPEVPEHSRVFYKILKKFFEFGELTNIDPRFKSQVFEDFMKESISKKNWGQYFTPRNIIDAIIEISDIEKLQEGSKICDPACGVGGFILEPLKVKEDGLNFYFKIENDKLVQRYKFYGFDKGFEQEEQLTIILAKSNMLIFLSELLKSNPTITDEFANLFNNTFRLLHRSILGTLNIIEPDQYDLIMTNPPYVTSGSANYKEAIKRDARLSKFYKINSLGIEGLFMEWIIRSLKPNRKAFVIVPDGLLTRSHDVDLRKFIKDECIIDGIISLPINAFYTTSKKTYILAITKKPYDNERDRLNFKQKTPVFTYLVSNIGETLDINRFPIEENDMKEMVSLFNQFKGAKDTFKADSLRNKIQPIDQFIPSKHWAVDRWWEKEEKIELGLIEEEKIVTVEEFIEMTEEVEYKMNEYKEMLRALI